MRRALMTSVSHITQRISEQNAEKFGADGWEISAHSGARPSHAVYQGRQYPAKDYERIVKPLIEDYNCRHSAFPIILGVSEPVYTEKELEEIDPKPFTYEGRTYTAYQAQQQMRKMERAMRKQKDCCITADAAGDVENYTVASIKLRRQKDIYEDFCKAANSYTQYERQYVAGYDRSLAGKSSYALKVYKQMQTLVGTKTSRGTVISSVSDHFVGRSIQRKVSRSFIEDALTNPLECGKIKIDSNGNPSQEYIGANARVKVNPDTGRLITSWLTSTRLKKKYGVIT